MYTKSSLFNFQDYKDYLIANFSSNEAPIGIKSQFCKAVKIHNPYLSRVLSKKADLSLEQADLANQFFRHNATESHLFLLKVQYARASSLNLKNFFQDQITYVEKERFNLSKVLNLDSTLNETESRVYFSDPLYTVIHVLVSIPKFQRLIPLRKTLGISTQKLDHYLKFLIKCGLIIETTTDKDTQLKVGNTRIHLGKSSPWLTQYHTQWRLHAIANLTSSSVDAVIPPLHYTSVMSLSKEDAKGLRESLTQWIKERESVISKSTDETAAVLAISCYDLETG